MKEEIMKLSMVCDNKICTGCQACKSVCPTKAIMMQENNRGFFYPSIAEDKCIGCHLCQKVCPAISYKTDFLQPQITIAGWSKNNTIRHYSTSGGFAYELSKWIVDLGGIFCGCRWNIDHAEHAFAENEEELTQFQGSKYAYSDVNDCYIRIKEYLKQGRKVLFVGTGCQVSGLKSFLGKAYDNLILVDLLCHGMPSQRVLRDRIKEVENENGGKKVKAVRFRDKREDQHHTYMKYIFEDGGSVYHAVYQDSFFRAFDSNYLLRPNCFTCQYAQEKRISDITLADFWGYTPGKFSFLPYRSGVSLALCNTEKGKEIIYSLHNIKKEERPLSMAIRGNNNLKQPQIKPIGYQEFWRRYDKGEMLSSLAGDFFPPLPIPQITKNTWKTCAKIIIGEEVRNKLSAFNWRRYTRWAYGPFIDYKRYRDHAPYRKAEIKRLNEIQPNIKHVFYLGITEQPNLGDMAQHYCIKRWIVENYPEYELVMFESSLITDPHFTDSFFKGLKRVFGKDDLIVIQSGYSTQDLGGDHPLMHLLICEYMQNARILMMPQTIYFKNAENKRICAENHNKAKNMLFLARDMVSYDMAKEMFTDIHVEAFPDIVTTLIGTLKFSNKRDGVCLCTRNDGEKYYNKRQIQQLAGSFERIGISVHQKDTQGKAPVTVIRHDLQKYIESEIADYSNFKVTITDRYHGTIFSLCAGTPVIIIKTKDHKVTTGADWFRGVYDDYIYVAEDLDDAYEKAKMIIDRKLDNQLSPFYKVNYYDKLREILESPIK